MALNPVTMLQLKASWDRFSQNHPKFLKFWKAAYRNGLEEGTVIEFKVTSPDGKEISSNMKLTAEDLEFVRQMKDVILM